MGPILAKQVSYDELTIEERLIYDASLMKGFYVIEELLLNMMNGIITEAQFEAKAQGFKVSFRHPTVKESWHRLQSSMSFSDEFKNFMNNDVYSANQMDESSYYAQIAKGTNT